MLAVQNSSQASNDQMRNSSQLAGVPIKTIKNKNQTLNWNITTITHVKYNWIENYTILKIIQFSNTTVHCIFPQGKCLLFMFHACPINMLSWLIYMMLSPVWLLCGPHGGQYLHFIYWCSTIIKSEFVISLSSCLTLKLSLIVIIEQNLQIICGTIDSNNHDYEAFLVKYYLKRILFSLSDTIYCAGDSGHCQHISTNIRVELRHFCHIQCHLFHIWNLWKHLRQYFELYFISFRVLTKSDWLLSSFFNTLSCNVTISETLNVNWWYIYVFYVGLSNYWKMWPIV